MRTLHWNRTDSASGPHSGPAGLTVAQRIQVQTLSARLDHRCTEPDQTAPGANKPEDTDRHNGWVDWYAGTLKPSRQARDPVYAYIGTLGGRIDGWVH